MALSERSDSIEALSASSSFFFAPSRFISSAAVPVPSGKTASTNPRGASFLTSASVPSEGQKNSRRFVGGAPKRMKAQSSSSSFDSRRLSVTCGGTEPITVEVFCVETPSRGRSSSSQGAAARSDDSTAAISLSISSRRATASHTASAALYVIPHADDEANAERSAFCFGANIFFFFFT